MTRLGLFVVATIFALLSLAGVASAAPVWRIVTSAPSDAVPGGSLRIMVRVMNVGDAPTDGSPTTLDAKLPAGLTIQSASMPFGSAWDCAGIEPDSSSLSCTDNAVLNGGVSELSLENSQTLNVNVNVDPSALGPRTVSFSVYGGGASRVDGSPCAQSEADLLTLPVCASAIDPTTITDADPVFGVDAFAVQSSGDAAGAPFAQAGGHPYALTTTIDFTTALQEHLGEQRLFPLESAKDIEVEVPPGLIGNPTTAAKCSTSEVTSPEGISFCPPSAQVGTVRIVNDDVYTAGRSAVFNFPIPLFNMIPPAGVPARFGFNVLGVVVALDAKLRSNGDYGLSIGSLNASQGVNLHGVSLTFWGVPADPGHDRERACQGQRPPVSGGPSCPANVPREAFLRLPTSCQGPQAWKIRTDSWLHPGAFAEASFLSVGNTGCDEVPFEPTITVEATSNQADSPTGLNVDVTMPQSDDPDAISQADVKSARVTLPEGMVVNPAAADGLVGCSQEQVGLHSSGDPSCPDASKIGTVEIVSPDLEDPLKGSIYQAKQFDDPSHSLLAFYTVVKGSGVTVKLAAHVERDPNTGQLTTVFDDNPQLPFERYSLRFDSGPRAPLINPPTCGTQTMAATFTSWARPDEQVKRQSSFQIATGPNGSPCPNGLAGRPFAPKLSGGSLSPLAGATTPFAMRLTREDGEQRFAGLSVSPPEGLSAYLKGVPYCPEAALAAISAVPGTGALQLASPSCPAASQVGTVVAGTGAGPLPFFVDTGRAYLAGPYKGAPLSLAIVVPAVAGPLDLGSVLTRAAIYVDPATAKLNVLSDPLPQIIEGIPLDVRDLRVAIDRPGFALNPTSCDPMNLEARVTGSDGAVANPAQHFQLAECARLGFKPRLSFSLKGGTKRDQNPAFKAVLRARPGDANIAKAQVTLPHSAFLDQAHIRTICTRVQYAADNCPKGSVYGYARAFTPLLDKPLQGPVYLRSSSNPLPDLVASLDGQIHVDLAGRIDSHKGGIRNTFNVVPDAPVSKFVLTLKGGSKGLIVNSRDLCRSVNRATVLLDGQNGKVRDSRVVLRAQACL